MMLLKLFDVKSKLSIYGFGEKCWGAEAFSCFLGEAIDVFAVGVVERNFIKSYSTLSSSI